jgi:tryptophanyl-tRNA synthetase
MGLQTPTAKISQSDPIADNYVALLDPPDVVHKKNQNMTGETS